MCGIRLSSFVLRATRSPSMSPNMARKCFILMAIVSSFINLTNGFRQRFVLMSSSRDYSPSGAYKRNNDRSITSIPTSPSIPASASIPASTSHSVSAVSSVDIDDNEARSYLKTQLFARCAACDRGYGANNNDRLLISDLVSELQLLTPEKTPTRGLFPNNNTIDSAPI